MPDRPKKPNSDRMARLNPEQPVPHDSVDHAERDHRHRHQRPAVGGEEEGESEVNQRQGEPRAPGHVGQRFLHILLAALERPVDPVALRERRQGPAIKSATTALVLVTAGSTSAEILTIRRPFSWRRMSGTRHVSMSTAVSRGMKPPPGSATARLSRLAMSYRSRSERGRLGGSPPEARRLARREPGHGARGTQPARRGNRLWVRRRAGRNDDRCEGRTRSGGAANAARRRAPRARRRLGTRSRGNPARTRWRRPQAGARDPGRSFRTVVARASCCRSDGRPKRLQIEQCAGKRDHIPTSTGTSRDSRPFPAWLPPGMERSRGSIGSSKGRSSQVQRTHQPQKSVRPSWRSGSPRKRFGTCRCTKQRRRRGPGQAGFRFNLRLRLLLHLSAARSAINIDHKRY